MTRYWIWITRFTLSLPTKLYWLANGFNFPPVQSMNIFSKFLFTFDVICWHCSFFIARKKKCKLYNLIILISSHKYFIKTSFHHCVVYIWLVRCYSEIQKILTFKMKQVFLVLFQKWKQYKYFERYHSNLKRYLWRREISP
jgi:hypothetical protein